MIARTIPPLVSILLAMPLDAAQATEASYRCDGGTRLTATFSPPGQTPSRAVLRIDGTPGETILPQVMSADGGRYASDTMEFWIKGTEATLTRAGKSETCRAR
jgi:membrane-bound inhibitor of C-type lysozyme